MTDIFLSYAREDQARAQQLANALEVEGWSVFWDRTIPTGMVWRDVIGKAMSQARCIIVIWSQFSVTSNWVQEEADEGRERGILIPILIDEVRPPIGFRSMQVADLTGWIGNPDMPAFRKLVTDVGAMLTAGEKESQKSKVLKTAQLPATDLPSNERAPLPNSAPKERHRWKLDRKTGLITIGGGIVILIASYYSNILEQIGALGSVDLEASSDIVPGLLNDRGDQVHDFKVGLRFPPAIKSGVTHVDYLFDHPSFTQPLLQSYDPFSNFSVSYRGWGCMRRVTVTVHFENGSQQKRVYDMCKALLSASKVSVSK